MIRRKLAKAGTARRHAVMLCVGQMLLLVQPTIEASDQRLEGSVLEIHLRAKQFVDPVSKKAQALDGKPVYVLRKADTVALQIVDPNPLLFTYSIDVTDTETEQHKIAAEFAKSLAKALEPYKSLNAAGQAERSSVLDGLDLTQFKNDLGTLHDDIAGIPSQIAQSTGSDAEISQMKEAVAALPDVEELAKRLTNSFQGLSAMALKCAAGRPLIAQDGTAVSCLEPFDPKMEREAATRVANRQSAPPSTTPSPPSPPPQVKSSEDRKTGPSRPGDKPLRRQTPAPVASSQPEKTASTAPPAPAVYTQSIQDFVALTQSMRGDVKDSLAVLLSFVADVAQVNTPRKLKCKDQPTCGYSINTQTVTIRVSKSSKYNAFLTNGVKEKQTAALGEHSLTLTPYTPATIGLAPAFVVLFINNPTYKATKKGDQYVIEADNNGQTSSYNVAAMLTITPKAWSEPTFGGQFQLGVSPTKDKIGFYLGAGIHVQEVFTFGAGVALQQVSRLAGGLTLGQTIQTADLLKTESVYKPGLYLHITVNIK